MALDPALVLSSLTNAQCAALRNDILEIFGIPPGMKVSGLLRRVKLGRDVIALRDAKNREQAAYAVMQANEEAAVVALAAQQASQRALAESARADQVALSGQDYGSDR